MEPIFFYDKFVHQCALSSFAVFSTKFLWLAYKFRLELMSIQVTLPASSPAVKGKFLNTESYSSWKLKAIFSIQLLSVLRGSSTYPLYILIQQNKIFFRFEFKEKLIKILQFHFQKRHSSDLQYVVDLFGFCRDNRSPLPWIHAWEWQIPFRPDRTYTFNKTNQCFNKMLNTIIYWT